ncbi:YfaP [Vibrio phage 2.275.O._10N.286.54.E11]|nr:YfaP [Vibrio phage 2.275.O._10N.286.54.E11]
MDFHDLKVAVSKQFDFMASKSTNLFASKASRDELWNTYLGSFPEGTNPIYKERPTYDCNCCKQFIRAAGNALAIIDGEVVSIWDVQIGGYYQVVVDAMAALVREKGIGSVFLHAESAVGTDFNMQQIEGEPVKRWDHFHQVLPRYSVVTDGSIGKKKGDSSSNRAVLERSLVELTDEAVDVVLELIDQKSLYRGEEHKRTVTTLQTLKREYLQAENKDLYLWTKSVELGRVSAFRNTVIGSLIQDLSEGIDLEVAVKKFEVKVAPQNYKRPTALVTQSMVNNAQAKVEELGAARSLPRRRAVTTDITINNVLFADRSAKESMGELMDILGTSVKRNTPKMDKVDEVSIQDFIDNILPKADSLEVMVDNKHTNNFVSLIAPENADAPNILKWDNNFSWSYNGEVADSMKERVKAAGGQVTGDLRFSIQWNDDVQNRNDLDAHCKEPGGNEIYFNNKGRRHASSGMLDVDIMSPGDKVAVENIIYSDRNKMPEGDYNFFVNNYSGSSGENFTAEIEFDGTIHTLNFVGRCSGRMQVATVNYSRTEGFTIKEHLPSATASKEVWGVTTNAWTKVQMVMNSPNHWDGEETGNKHFFFMLEGCKDPDTSRGFYNEFLSAELNEHRKVFELLGGKMRVQPTNEQLSGVGFSSTSRNEVLVKVSGAFNRVVKVKF